ncbi:MAG: substrate-binding domain-containing protein [Burkholderiales bacterium]|nr:substrate-binding domain-containing protein [Burkholderiales bacterium]
MKNLTIYAAGCFRFVISKLCTEFAEQRKSEVAPEFCVGASGMMAHRIASGENAGAFLSANKHWAEVAAKIWSSKVHSVCSNDLAILTSCEQTKTHKDALELLTDPSVILGFTDPKLDPSGQYTFELLLPKIQANYPELYASLKDRCFVIGKEYLELKLPVGVTLPQYLIEEHKIQAMAAYGSGARSGHLAKGMTALTLPPVLQTSTECYGVANGDAGKEFLDFCLSAKGQEILQKYGFLAAKG